MLLALLSGLRLLYAAVGQRRLGSSVVSGGPVWINRVAIWDQVDF